MYEVRQTKEKKYFFNLIKRNTTKAYKFKKLNEAQIFCLNEQIKHIYVNIGKGITTIRRPFKFYYTLEQFKKLAFKNPLFYLGVNNPERIHIETYYFYLIQNNLQKLKKFN